MKYFSKELYILVSDVELSEGQRTVADEAWKKAGDDLLKQIQKYKHKYQKKLYEVVCEDCFHDANIESIRFVKTHKKRKSYEAKLDVYITLKRRGAVGDLIHYDVDLFNSQMDYSIDKVSFNDYMYGEIFYEDKMWMHNFLFRDANEINIRCRRIEWIIKKTPE